MESLKRAGVIEAVESGGRGRRERLKTAQVARATYYRRKSRYEAEGTPGLERRGRRAVSWMRLTPEEDARALQDLPAAKEWEHKTTAPDQSCDSISDAVELALEKKPLLLSDNGAGLIGDQLSRYLGQHGIRHIFGRPYHPQTQGKVEAVNKKIKGRVKMLVYCSPEQLEAAVEAAVRAHNATPREKLKNVSPDDVYAGRMDEILKRRAEIKRQTPQRRKEYNRARRLESQRSCGGQVSQNG